MEHPCTDLIQTCNVFVCCIHVQVCAHCLCVGTFTYWVINAHPEEEPLLRV